MEIKSAHEIYEEVSKESAECNNYSLKQISIECMKRFAEQFVDLALEQSQEMIYDSQDTKPNNDGGLILRDFQVCYAIPKQTIVKLKEIIK